MCTINKIYVINFYAAFINFDTNYSRSQKTYMCVLSTIIYGNQFCGNC